MNESKNSFPNSRLAVLLKHTFDKPQTGKFTSAPQEETYQIRGVTITTTALEIRTHSYKIHDLFAILSTNSRTESCRMVEQVKAQALLL